MMTCQASLYRRHEPKEADGPSGHCERGYEGVDGGSHANRAMRMVVPSITITWIAYQHLKALDMALSRSIWSEGLASESSDTSRSRHQTQQ